MSEYSIINFDNPIKAVTSRSCDGCTTCCEGWLYYSIFGYDVFPGMPCKFVIKHKGCKAYDVRPYDPCKAFTCYWKQDPDIPENLKPSKTQNIMIYRKSAEGVLHLDLIQAGKPISIEILNFALMRFRTKKVDSVRWWIDGKLNYVSRDERFIDMMEKRLSAIDQKDE